MKVNKLNFVEIPTWAYPQTASFMSFCETITLIGVEGKSIRISANDQRKILGHNVFGKQSIIVNNDGSVKVTRKTCFGMDSESFTYQPDAIKNAIENKKSLSPGA